MNASRRLGRWLPLVAFGALAVLLGAGVWLSRKSDRDVLPSPLIGKPAPAFSLPVLHEPGRVLTLDALRGQPFVLNVWGSWCVSCRVEHPLLVDMAKKQLVPIVGLDYKDQRVDGMKWLTTHGDPYVLSAFDDEGKVGIDYGVYGVPETFVIDKQGVIRYKQIGPITQEALDRKILPLVRKLNG